MQICGIDLGTRKSAVSRLYVPNNSYVLDPATSLIYAVSLMVHPASRANELAMLSSMTAQACLGADYVFVEEPLVGRGVKASMQISQVAGAVLSRLTELQLKAELVHVSHWKKAIIGKGNANKADIEMFLNHTYPEYAAHCDDQDQRDATCLALYGYEVLASAEAGVFRDESSDEGPEPGGVSGS